MSTPAVNALALAKLAAEQRAAAISRPVQRGIRRDPVRRKPGAPEPSLFDADEGETGQ